MVPEILRTKDRIFCHFEPFFAHLPTKNPKNQNFEKMKKASADIIISHKCTKNHDHMLYCFWDMVGGGCKCGHVLTSCDNKNIITDYSS